MIRVKLAVYRCPVLLLLRVVHELAAAGDYNLLSGLSGFRSKFLKIFITLN